MRASILCPLALAGAVLAHGDHPQKPIVDEHANWMTKHMAGIWDAGSFFTLHDYNDDGIWQVEELRRTYGLMDESNKDFSVERKAQVMSHLMNLLDTDDDGSVSRAEWTAFIAQGKTLPDMGTGPGHHGDDEYEYEIHHWEQYHDENTKIEDLTHPEDIEHFKKHEEMERAQEEQEAMDKQSIIEENIPVKFRRRD
ncbi:Putative calcium-binding protein [Tolypocladium paradoxum]|uniref:Calcium-binding protein n=1 Tax=Tolypocladium paradoxum TaxID=94208 RepID=A0A2S4KQC1_9HYPO|nr:Putative calcium-binding protein [Tolypocladium paradoxum]